MSTNNKETVYDTQIAPLMSSIIKMCKKNNIAMLAYFELDGDLRCTTALMSEQYEPSEKLLNAVEVVCPMGRTEYVGQSPGHTKSTEPTT